MRLEMKITPLRAGTAEVVDEPALFPCPPELEYDQIRSFLVQLFREEPSDIAWTTTDRHERIDIGWIFSAMPCDDPGNTIDLLCVPVLESDDGSRVALFELLADQRQDLEQLAASGEIDKIAVFEAALREYLPRPTAVARVR